MRFFPFSTRFFVALHRSRANLNYTVSRRDLDWSVRCSAAVLSHFQAVENPSSALDSVASLLVENCNSAGGRWLLDGLVITFLFANHTPNPEVTALVRDLFESCREDYLARATLEEILIRWRESSDAPVTTHGLRDRWLYREDRPPMP